MINGPERNMSGMPAADVRAIAGQISAATKPAPFLG